MLFFTSLGIPRFAEAKHARLEGVPISYRLVFVYHLPKRDVNVVPSFSFLCPTDFPCFFTSPSFPDTEDKPRVNRESRIRDAERQS